MKQIIIRLHLIQLRNLFLIRIDFANSFFHSGKILRFDPATDDGIASNPFYDNLTPRSAKSRVWAMGCCNPSQISVQPNTGNTNPAAADPGTILIDKITIYQKNRFFYEPVFYPTR